MIIFLYGQDTYRLKLKLKEIVEHYKKNHKSGLSLRYFEGDNLDFQDFQESFRSVSMLKEKKLTILNNISSNKSFKDVFLKNIKKFVQSENTILFCQEGKIAADSFFSALKKQGKSQEFQLLKGLKLRNWVKKEFERQGAHIDKSALDRLLETVGSDLWQMSNEIKKLVAYKDGRTIEIKDVDLFVRPKIETDIFKTIDAIALKDKKKALALVHKHLQKGDRHLYLLAMIGFQFRNLLVIKSGARPKMHPYVMNKTIRQAEFFSFEELKKIYRKIFQADLDIKTGKTDADTALDLLISEI